MPLKDFHSTSNIRQFGRRGTWLSNLIENRCFQSFSTQHTASILAMARNQWTYWLSLRKRSLVITTLTPHRGVTMLSWLYGILWVVSSYRHLLKSCSQSQTPNSKPWIRNTRLVRELWVEAQLGTPSRLSTQYPLRFRKTREHAWGMIGHTGIFMNRKTSLKLLLRMPILCLGITMLRLKFTTAWERRFWKLI